MRRLTLPLALAASAALAQSHGGDAGGEPSVSSGGRDVYFALTERLAKIRDSLQNKQPSLWRELAEACQKQDVSPAVPKLVAQTLGQSLSKNPSREPALRGLSEKSFFEAYLVAAADTVGSTAMPCPDVKKIRDEEFSPCLRAHMAGSLEIGENLRQRHPNQGGDRIYSRLNFPTAWGSGREEHAVSLACFVTGQAGALADRHAMLAFRDVTQRGYRGVGADARGYVNAKSMNAILQKWQLPPAKFELPAAFGAQGELVAPTQSYDMAKGSPWRFLGFRAR